MPAYFSTQPTPIILQQLSIWSFTNLNKLPNIYKKSSKKTVVFNRLVANFWYDIIQFLPVQAQASLKGSPDKSKLVFIA